MKGPDANVGAGVRREAVSLRSLFDKPTTRRASLPRKALASAVALLLTACPLGPNFVRPEAPKVSGYTPGENPGSTLPAEGQAQKFVEGKKIVADWWRLFGNERVDRIVSDAIAHNWTLAAAQATLRQSQDNLRAGYGIFFPQLEGNIGASRQTSDLERIGVTAGSSVYNLFTLSASVSYTLDIWGGQRRQVESLAAQMDAQRYNVLAARITLSGNVVNTAIAEAAYRAQIQATEELIALEKDQVNITQAQAQAGTVPFANVLSIQSLLASAEATLPPLEEKIDQSQHLLAVLTGRTPAEWKSEDISLSEFTLPSDLPLSLPSDFVRQRPDILMAEAQLHDANAQIGVRTAAMLPNLTLSPSVGSNSLDITKIFQPASLFWSLAANIAGPIFDGGTLWFQRKAAIEAHDAVLAQYKQTVLSAFEQVADTLQALQHDAETLQAESEAVRTAADALKLVQLNYQSGVANYLQVLTADEQFHQASIARIQAQAQRLQDTVALYVALGGGWWNEPKPIVLDRMEPPPAG